MQNCENVIQEGEVKIKLSLCNYIFKILNYIFNFLCIIFSAAHSENLHMHVYAYRRYVRILGHIVGPASWSQLYAALVAILPLYTG